MYSYYFLDLPIPEKIIISNYQLLIMKGIAITILLCHFVASAKAQCGTACNELVPNGGFEYVDPAYVAQCGIIPQMNLIPPAPVYNCASTGFNWIMNCWQQGVGEPWLNLLGCSCSLVTNVHPLSTTANQRTLTMTSAGGGGDLSTIGPQALLSEMIQPYTDYTISFWARSNYLHDWQYKLPELNPKSAIEFGLSHGTIVPSNNPAYIFLSNAYSYGFPGCWDDFHNAMTPITFNDLSGAPQQYFEIQPDDQWRFYTQTFNLGAAGGISFNNFIMLNGDYILYPLYNMTQLWRGLISVDDISIKPTKVSCTFTPPAQVGNCHVPIDLSQYVSVPGGTFDIDPTYVPALPAISPLSGSIFDPANAAITPLPALVTFSYTYSIDGCTYTTYAQINVIDGTKPDFAPTASPNTVCTGGSSDLDANVTSTGTYTYSWTPIGPSNGVPSGTANTSSPTVNPVHTTTYSLTVTDPNTLCFDTKSVIVNVPTINLTADNDVICSSIKSITLTASSDYTFTDYTWSASPCTTCSSIGITTPLVTTTYSVSASTIINDVLCVDTAYINIVVPTSCYCDYIKNYKSGSIIGNTSANGSPPYIIDQNLDFSGSPMPAPAVLYLDNNVTIIGDVKFNNIALLINDGITITVDPNSSLQISNSHLYACEKNMWNGIFLDNNSISTGKLTIDEHSMIEDAKTAISIGKVYPPNDGKNIIELHDVIFNRNKVGMEIDACPYALTAAPYTYPFVITNTIFTSRNFGSTCCSVDPHVYSSYGVMAHYPISWPDPYTPSIFSGVPSPLTSPFQSNYSLKKTGNWTPASIFSPPYNIDNPKAYRTPAYGVGYSGFDKLDCKDGSKDRKGIVLNYVGSTDVTATTKIYSEIQIGAANFVGEKGINETQNIFDNLMYGIQALNSNFTSVNNVFMYMNAIAENRTYPAPVVGGSGIFALADGSPATVYDGRARIYTEGTSIGDNEYYDNKSAVDIQNYSKIIGLNTKMRSTQDVTAPGYSYIGRYGYNIRERYYEYQDISSNDISNIVNGIAVTTGISNNMPNSNVLLGMLNVNDNTITAHPAGYSSISTQSVNVAISLQNLLDNSYIKPLPPPISYNVVNANHNTINDAYNGIYVSGYRVQHPRIYNNTMSLRQYASPAFQYGIDAVTNGNTTIQANHIAVDNYGVSTSQADTMWKGIFVSNSIRSNVKCNWTEGMGVGQEFFGNNVGTTWHHNDMYLHRMGYMLNNAAIGQQGNSTTPIDNKWMAGNWSSSNYETFTIHFSIVANSILYVRTGVTTNPVNTSSYNGSQPTGSTHTYTGSGFSPSVIAFNPTSFLVDCAEINDQVHGLDLHHHIARNEVDSATDGQRRWIGQYQLWEAMMGDSTLADSSDVLADFQSIAASTRYAHIWGIDTALSAGNDSAATAMLSDTAAFTAPTGWIVDSSNGVIITDDSDANNIVANYLMYYNTYLHYIHGVMTDTDTAYIAGMAYLCPMHDGMVVYQARALYRALLDTLVVFNDDSLCTAYLPRHGNNNNPHSPTYGTSKKLIDGQATQAYNLYPNPNDGNISIIQRVAENEPVHVVVYNSIGQSVYTGSLQFTSYKSSVQLGSISSGVYLMSITDTKGNNFHLKFVVR